MRKTYLSQMGKKQQQLNSLAKTAKKESKGEIFKMEGGKWEEDQDGKWDFNERFKNNKMILWFFIGNTSSASVIRGCLKGSRKTPPIGSGRK